MEFEPDLTLEQELATVVESFRRQYIAARAAKYVVGTVGLANIAALATVVPPDNMQQGIFGAVNVGIFLTTSLIYPLFSQKENELKELINPEPRLDK